MVIEWEQISPGDESLGRRVLVLARTIAPCLDSLEGEALKNAVAVLEGVVQGIRARGARGIKSQTIGPARVEYIVDASSFDDDARTSLASLCALPDTSRGSAGAPVGSFPVERPVGRVWPEVYR